jgi:uncharacterized protein (TIGR02453 family)
MQVLFFVNYILITNSNEKLLQIQTKIFMKTQSIEFMGFHADAKKFLVNLKENNNKEWFIEHKAEFERLLKQPSLALVEAMALIFEQDALQFVAEPRVSLFRQNRDIRFSSDKSPYKTNIGIYFPFSKEPIAGRSFLTGGLYFHYEPDSSFVAAGIHNPTPMALKAVRELICDEWQELNKILSSNDSLNEFPVVMTGDKLKRVPNAFPKNHPKEEWLRLKEFIIWCDLKHEDSAKADFIDLLHRKAKTALPFLSFLNKAIESIDNAV